MPWPKALALLDEQTGRRIVLALTDGEDTASESASLDTAIAAARRLGLPVYTLGLGTEEEIASRSSLAGHIDPRPVLPRPQRRPAQSDVRDHRRPNRHQLHTRLRVGNDHGRPVLERRSGPSCLGTLGPRLTNRPQVEFGESPLPFWIDCPGFSRKNLGHNILGKETVRQCVRVKVEW